MIQRLTHPDNEAIIAKLGETSHALLKRCQGVNRQITESIREAQITRSPTVSLRDVLEISTASLQVESKINDLHCAVSALTSPSAAELIADDITREINNRPEVDSVSVPDSYTIESIPAFVDVALYRRRWMFSDRKRTATGTFLIYVRID